MKFLTDQAAVFRLFFLIAFIFLFTVGVATASQPDHAEPAGAPSSEHLDSSSTHQDSHNASAAHQAADAHHGAGHENIGKFLPLWSCIPFACILLSIALFPLILPDFWHHHFGKISGFWALMLAVPFLIAFKGAALYEILHIILADYVPFIILLWSLYTVSGGILLRGTLRGTPMVNVIILI
ncbi:MAG: sodium:proton antiporter, partial [Desulfobacterales bacterium]